MARIAVRQPCGARSCAWLRWGLVPSWTLQLEGKSPPLLINARADGVAKKPSFRAAFKARRCLIPADGFFEWQALSGRKQKQPFHIHRPGQEPFAFAGLWERWVGPDGKALDSCAIITTEVNGFMRAVHDRMPVILPPEQYAR